MVVKNYIVKYDNRNEYTVAANIKILRTFPFSKPNLGHRLITQNSVLKLNVVTFCAYSFTSVFQSNIIDI